MKCRISTILLSVLLIVSATNLWAQQRPESFGAWTRGSNYDLSVFPYKGIEVGPAWSDIEPSKGVFDWSSIDVPLADANRANVYFFCSINVGPHSPLWLYNNGVPEVYTEGHLRSGPYPYYFDPEHKFFYYRLIEKFGEHIRSLPRHLSGRIVGVQAKTGATGDEAAYKGSVKAGYEKYEINKNSPEWRDYRLAAFEKFDAAFQEGPGPKIPLLFNSCRAGKWPVEWGWVTTNITAGLGHKLGGLGQSYQLNDVPLDAQQVLSYIIDPDPAGIELFTRCEMDQTWKKPYFTANTRMNFYWTAISALHGGVCMWNVSTSAREWCTQNDYWEHAHFFNRYAGQIFPQSAGGAFCALRDGLDSSDKVRFPESRFGQAVRNNRQRYMDICNVYSARGAKMDDPDAVLRGQMYQRSHQTGFNDAGWEIFRGNYERFLHQVNANQTSVGLWRVGGEINQSTPVYARFARGFDNAGGKNTMYFDINDKFFANAPLNGAYPVTLRVIYYDSGTGKWALKYDAVGNSRKTAYTVTKTNSGTWKEKSVTLNDAYFGNRCPNSSDLMLASVDNNDDIFHLIEIARDTGAPSAGFTSSATQLSCKRSLLTPD